MHIKSVDVLQMIPKMERYDLILVSNDPIIPSGTQSVDLIQLLRQALQSAWPELEEFEAGKITGRFWMLEEWYFEVIFKRLKGGGQSGV